MKKIFLLIIILSPFISMAQQETKQQKKEERREHINQLIKQEEEGALIFQKQGAFGIKLNTDGYGIFYEHGKFKTINKTRLWWAELGERKNSKEEKLTNTDAFGFTIGNPFIYGKVNNFYYLKLGLGEQRLIGGKGNKNGVATSLIYGGGLSLALMKPYFLQVPDSSTGGTKDIDYWQDSTTFLNGPIIGASGFTKGFGNIKYVPGAYIRAALRFDYGRYNEILSAIEVGINAEFYSQKVEQMALNPKHNLFFNAYLALVFGSRR